MSPSHTDAIASADDERFTLGLLADVIAVLERHGYKASTDAKHTARALLSLLELTRSFEGK
jgi:uncharacterized protein YejL (UPF0352 family)